MFIRRFLLGLSIISLLSIIRAQYNNPLKDPGICGKRTCKGNDKFKYRPGVRQVYNYRVDVVSLFNGTSKNESTLHVLAEIALDFLSECDGLLSISDVKLSEKVEALDVVDEDYSDNSLHYNSEDFSEELSRYPVRFSFQDGIISELCPDEEEVNWALNFKRGVLSMLHNTMKRLDLDHTVVEDDVRGRCDTTYKIIGPRDSSLIIQKVKELGNCQSRSEFHSVLQSTPYRTYSNNRGESLMKSKSHCDLLVDHNIYKSISCEESHFFEPFSNRAAGATTTVKQQLILQDEIRENVEEQPSITRRTSLLYDHVPTPKPTSGELKTSRDLLKQLCKLNVEDVQTEFSDLFTKFIHTARLLSQTALTTLYGHAGTICVSGKKHMTDALPYLGSDAAVALMTNIIINQGIPVDTIQEWMLALAFIPRPSERMMKIANELLEHKNSDSSITFGVSALTRTFCTQNFDCYSNEPTQQIIELLESQSTDSYRRGVFNDETHENILVALKALANIGVMSDAFKEELYAMIADARLEVGVRVAAVQTFRRLPCEESRPFFEGFFKNQDEEAEVRIATYLQIMRCPNYLVIRRIQHSLEVEEVNQVGSFIWSHLRNLLKSSIPNRVEVQSLLSDKKLSKKFSSDARKFSQNYEGSVYFDEYNIGANYESNVIFSPSSYVPRAAMLNLTVDLFGESINLLEVNGRAEGFENYFESIFGPKGPFNAAKMQEKIPKMRWPRSVSENELLNNEMKELPEVIKTNFKRPKVSFGLKVFGNELKHSTFNGKEEIKTALHDLNPVDYLERILSGKEINYNKAAMFLDCSYVIPSGAGFPITLNAVGTASVNLKLFGALRAPDFMKTKELDLVGDVRPSAAVDIIGTISVDAYYATTAIKLKTNMYTSSAVEGSVKIRGTDLVSVNFSLPWDKTEIFGARSELIVVKDDIEHRQKGIESNRVSQSACSWPVVDKTIGLKLCAHYHFTNVTKIDYAPYFILAGPAGFGLSLQKADPTAKTYILEYKWSKSDAGSAISLTLDTPGSTLRRLLGANLTLDTQTNNVTLLLHSPRGTIIARGKYKNTEMEKYLQIALDVDAKKHLDASLSLEQIESRNGFTYIPKVYLGVNGDRVAELQGSLKWVSKKGISQCDVDLKFQTKRLNSKVFGYISKSDASLGTNLKLDYKFVNTKEQRATLEFLVANRSTRTLIAILGDMRVETTAYPHFNFEAALKFQRASGRMEYKFQLNSCSDLRNPAINNPEKLTVVAEVKHRTLQNGTRFDSKISINRNATDLAVGGEFYYYVTGPHVDTKLLVKYGQEKEVTVAASWYRPRGIFLHNEGRVAVTMPTYNTMLFTWKINEKRSSDYDVELSSTWFSGYNIKVRGVYQDKGSAKASNHHIKVLVQTSDSEEIDADCQFYRDDYEIKIDLKGNRNNENYGFLYKYITTSPFEISTHAKIKYKTQIYSVTSLVNLKERKQILLEFHFDHYRDIHLALWGHNEELRKTAGFEIKWDANRDPNQKLAILVEFFNPLPYNYVGNFIASYPGRTIKGIFNFVVRDGHFSTRAQLAWSAVDILGIKFSTDYKNDVETLLLINLEAITPLQEWKKISINGGYHHKGNMRRLNGSVYWRNNQHISVDLLGDYEITSSVLKYEFITAILSNLQDFPSFASNIKHHHNASRVDTYVHIAYHPKQVISLKSSWRIDHDETMKNLTGTVSLVSPFVGYNKGLLFCKIYVTNKRELRGAADLDVDHRKYTASVEGHYQRFTNSMFVFNITTPMEKYKKLSGRLGLSEERKHLVALIQMPTSTVGIEIKFLVESLEKFDVKVYAGTPIEILRKILVVGKLQHDMVDLRLGWNSLVGGFSGVWHYANVTDFEYSYKIYTPIEGFEQNGIVAKLIFKEGLDFEVSVRLAENRLGVAVEGKPKPKILDELGIKTQAIYAANLADSAITDFEAYVDENEIEEPISWSGFLEVNLIIYPTITGTLDIDQKGTLYVLLGELKLPDGVAELKNEFNFEDFLTFKNKLYLTTPYDNFKVITSTCDIEIIMEEMYRLGLDFNYKNGSRWIKTGGLANYFVEVDRRKAIHNLTFHVHTPFKKFPRLDLHSALEMKETVYRFDFAATTNSTDISIGAYAEMDESVLSANVDLHLICPLIVVPPIKFNFKKRLSQIENKIELYFDMLREKPTKFNITTTWKFETLANFKTNLELETPFKGMEKAEFAVSLTTAQSNGLGEVKVLLYPINFRANATLKNNDLRSWIISEFKNERNDILLHCTLTGLSQSIRNIEGDLKTNKKLYRVIGTVELSKDSFPIKLQVDIDPQDASSPFHLQYHLQSQLSGHALAAKLSQGQKFIHVEAQTTLKQEDKLQVHVKISTSNTRYTSFIADAEILSNDTSKNIIVTAKTPFQNLENPRFALAYRKFDLQRNVKFDYEVSSSKGSVESEWCWVLMENMTVRLISNYESANFTRKANVELFYVNPDKSFNALNVRGYANIDKDWSTDNTLKLSMSSIRNVNLEVISKLSNLQVHRLDGNFHGTKEWDDVRYFVKYGMINSDRIYGISGKILYPHQSRFTGNVDVEWNKNRVDNYLDWTKSNNTLNLHYKLRTPKFGTQDTLTTNFNYKGSKLYHNVTCQVFYPASRSVAAAQVDFREFANMNGTMNVTTPFKRFKYLGSHFKTETSGTVHNRFVELFWPRNKAHLGSKCTTTTGLSALERDTVGVLLIELPLTTRHLGRINYNYSERPNRSVGRATVDYNEEKILEGKYNCVSLSRVGYDKDTVHVELENRLVPIGLAYVHGYEYTVSRDDTNTPTVDFKRLEVYHLYNRTGFNVTGEVLLRTTFTGRQIGLTAIHSDRVVKFSTDYDVLEQQFKQHSKIELAPTVWIAYDLDILNKTTDENAEAQQVQIDVSYPKRNFTALGSYNITNFSISSEMSLLWDEQRKTVEAAFDWKRDPSPHYSRQEIELQIRHPSFEKNVSILGKYESNRKRPLDLNVTVDYSTNLEQKFELNGYLENLVGTHISNYTYRIWGKHPATNLHLDARGGICWRPRLYNTRHLLDYKRTYLPMQSREALARIDVDNKEIEFKKKSLRELSYLWSRYTGKFPLYTANVSAIHGKDINASGVFYLNFKEKLVKFDLNITEDGSQSAHVFGEIPDARSSGFDIWRDYEDIRVSDVSYFLRLNHSRLIVSKLTWRSELKQDIQNGIRTASVGLYNDIVDNADYWRQYLRSETVDAIAGVWQDAKPVVRDFLDDLRDLRDINEDVEELKEYFRETYEANEFYIHDIVNFTMGVIDELSISSHFESLPKIFNEIWEVMGETGERLQKRILWVIETIKSYYEKTAIFINDLFQGDAIEHISQALAQLVENYDNFIKEMHVSFIQFLENLWKQTYTILVNSWHKALIAIEPTLIRVTHYFEELFLDASREIMDFMYIRSNEILQSPYFEKLSILIHNLDKFYKDVTGKNAIWNIYKYAKKSWIYISEKYLKLIPFGKEFQAVCTEILMELNELRKLPSVKYFSEKYNEIYEKVHWFFDYFEIETKLRRFITLVHLKLTDMTQTALETENRYREAKTKFIYEPNEGIVYLEQKLPMSWHAFNETPKFQEIPELKTINNVQNYFLASKTNFWNFYYDYKPYTVPSDWFPPFKAQAMIAGSQYYVTFDRKYYNFRGQCTYLLASDFLDRNFSMAISYDVPNFNSPELIVASNGTVVHINVNTDVVRISGVSEFKLPTQIKDMHLYRESDILTLESAAGFVLQCNMKFDVCMLEISGWYFGKTAGLWGTMNNEPSDDLLTSDGRRTKVEDVGEFAQSWTLGRKCTSTESTAVSEKKNETPEEIKSLCEVFFSSKVSPFVTCFPRVSSDPFLDMCLKCSTESEACTFAVAYMNLCAVENTPLRIPEACVKCNLLNGSTVSEGEFIRFEGNAVPRSTDVVFVIEAKECNKNLRTNRNMDVITELLNKELLQLNVTQNRYSVVVFGGNGVLDKPRSVVIDGDIFTDYNSVNSYFDHLLVGEGNSDIFRAIIYASKLIFRPGVSKTFILLPCTDCHESNMKLDYTILHQLLLENDITLHILMNEEFRFQKTRVNKIFFGVDRTRAYTKKDVRKLKGDSGLLRQVRLPKSTLGFCTPLALETNGSVFSGKKLETDKINAARRFITVFSKRVAQSALPSKCQMCECTAPNTGVSYMECFPCSYPTRATIDYGFNEDETLFAMQPTDEEEYESSME